MIYRDPEGLVGQRISLGGGYTARADYFTVGGQTMFEYHVFDAKNIEIGIAGPNGW